MQQIVTLSSGGNWGASVIELPSYLVKPGNSITDLPQLPPDDNVINLRFASDQNQHS